MATNLDALITVIIGEIFNQYAQRHMHKYINVCVGACPLPVFMKWLSDGALFINIHTITFLLWCLVSPLRIKQNSLGIATIKINF
jgi:hypothetical protein